MRDFLNRRRPSPAARPIRVFIFVLLAIEFLDEFAFGIRDAAWPLIRDDLALSYIQVGLLLSLPNLIGNLIEPFLYILGDIWQRRALVLGGGVVFIAGLALTIASTSFMVLLVALVLLYPASGAFVSISQATLMDGDPARREQNMARWTVAGSLGMVLGPLVLGAAAGLGAGWRTAFALVTVVGLLLLAVVWRAPFPKANALPPGIRPLRTLREGLSEAARSLRRREVVRWLVLLQLSDLMLDVLLGYLALYFVDVVATGPAEAGLAVAVWTGVGLVGDLLMIPLLERVPGLRYLRLSVFAELVLFPTFLLVPGFVPKVAVLALLGLFNAGWYAILQAQLYGAMPGRSGTAMAVGNVANLVFSLVPLALGMFAERLGLEAAMWLLLAGPLGLLLGMPWRSPTAGGPGVQE